MDVDLKALAMIVGPLVVGGGSGFIGAEVQIAALDARVTKIEQVEEGFATKESVEAAKAAAADAIAAIEKQQNIYIQAMQVIHDDIDARLDRHGTRLNRVEDAQ